MDYWSKISKTMIFWYFLINKFYNPFIFISPFIKFALRVLYLTST